jgi:hypothetical protein
MFYILLGVFFVGLIIVGLLFKFFIGRKPPGSLAGPLSIGLTFFQLLGLFKDIRLNWPPAVRVMFSIVSVAVRLLVLLAENMLFPNTETCLSPLRSPER